MNLSSLTKLLRRLPKFTAGVALLSLVTLAGIGMYNCTNPIMQGQMKMGEQHTMTDCAPGKNCGMDINKHLGIWQSMFTANFNSGWLNFFVSLLLVSFIIGIFKIWPAPEIYSRIARYLYYEREHPDSKLYNYFLRIFRNGILQPKLFA